jgi:hypothetical protein
MINTNKAIMSAHESRSLVNLSYSIQFNRTPHLKISLLGNIRGASAPLPCFEDELIM